MHGGNRLPSHPRELRPFPAVVLGILALATPLSVQWSNRYPRLAGFNHHVDLEGYGLSLLTAGPMDPAWCAEP